MFQIVKEQPHLPYVMVVADFQQLRPMSNGSMCRKFCERMETIELVTSYRSTDSERILFLSRIRDRQPDRATLAEYYGGRHWKDSSLEACVAYGLELGAAQGKAFIWLTATNRGSADVWHK